MENKEIVRIFSETADLMEISGDDPFRIRSYRNAVAAIENLTESVEEIAHDPERKLTDIPSIGKGMAAHIEEICRNDSRRGPAPTRILAGGECGAAIAAPCRSDYSCA